MVKMMAIQGGKTVTARAPLATKRHPHNLRYAATRAGAGVSVCVSFRDSTDTKSVY